MFTKYQVPYTLFYYLPSAEFQLRHEYVGRLDLALQEISQGMKQEILLDAINNISPIFSDGSEVLIVPTEKVLQELGVS